MKNLTITIDDKTKNDMEKLSEVNWSEVCREAIKVYIQNRQKNDRRKEK